MNYSNPVWSPDSRQIAFTCDTDPEAYEAANIYVVNANGSGLRNLTRNSGLVDHRSPVWAPNSHQLAFLGNRNGVYTIHDDRNNLKRLSDASPKRSETWGSWSPDGSQIAFEGKYDIYTIHIDGSNPKNLTNKLGGYNIQPVWSPDSEQIVFGHGEYGEEVYVMNADGSNPKRLISGLKYSYANWQPTGGQIAIRSGRNLYVVNSDGTDQKKFVSEGEVGDINWLPDGQHVVFDAGGNLSVIDLENSSLRKLYSHGGGIETAISPNGQRIVIMTGPFHIYGTWTFGTGTVYIMNTNGSGLRKLRPPYLILIIPIILQFVLVVRLYSKYRYVRQHVVQALILVGVSILIMASVIGSMGNPWYLVCGWIMANGLWCLVGAVWGLRQIKRGDCWLMRLVGEGNELPRPWAVSA